MHHELVIFIVTTERFEMYRIKQTSTVHSIRSFTLKTKYLIISLIVVFMSNCSSPVLKLQQYALSQNLSTMYFNQEDIPLLGYSNTKTGNPLDTVYIYLEGDGQPWDKGRWPASDPNTHQSIMLPLMTSTNKPSLYLTRPCYGLDPLPQGCDPSLWTSDRYSKKVVDSLNKAINQHQKQYKTTRYTIIGHSGGGALAMLLAAKRKDIAAVITVAANLNHNKWTQYFGYLPLSGSLNPPHSDQLIHLQQQWHLIAGNDKVIPESLLRSAVAAYPQARIFYYPDFTHQCCWQTIWPQLLDELDTQLNPSPLKK